VALREDVEAPSADALMQWCKDRMASFKRPRQIVFGELPKTATGKVQKFILRQRVRETSDRLTLKAWRSGHRGA
jgi:acyl-CoA synthetase (AMP-forming)/AMP-acid ligase II